MKTEIGDREDWEEGFAETIARLSVWPEAKADAWESTRVAQTVVQALHREQESSYLFLLACAGIALLLFLLTGLVTSVRTPALKPVHFLAVVGGLMVVTVPLLLTMVPLKNGRS